MVLRVGLLLVLGLGRVASAAEVREMSFADLEDQEGQKFVVFYDKSERSKSALAVLEALASKPTPGLGLEDYDFVKVSTFSKANADKLKEAGFTKYPQVAPHPQFWRSASVAFNPFGGALAGERVLASPSSPA